MRSLHGVVVLLIVAALVAYDKASELPTTEEDIASEDRWAHMSDLNTPHELHTAVVVDGKLYAVSQATTQSALRMQVVLVMARLPCRMRWCAQSSE